VDPGSNLTVDVVLIAMTTAICSNAHNMDITQCYLPPGRDDIRAGEKLL